jgi:hypothetical protein
MADENGVVISTKEMYGLVQEVSRSLQRIESRLDMLEAKMEYANSADERSREAFNLAEDAKHQTKELQKQIEKVESRQLWLWMILISGFVLGAINLLFNLLGKSILGG